MKNSTNLSSRENTINYEDRIINRDLIDPYKYEKRLLKVYDYESNKNKHNLNLNSIAIENNNSINLPKNSGIQNFNRIKDYMEREKNSAKNFNYNNAENINIVNNNNKRNLNLDNENEEIKNPANALNEFNYQNHLKVFNSLSNFSDSNDKTFNLNDSKLTFNSRIDNSENLNNNKNNFLTNLNNSNGNLNANLHIYDENLNKYKRNYLNTTDSRESSVNKNANERNHSNYMQNYNNKNNFCLAIQKNNYIKINESTEIPAIIKNEENNKYINIDNNPGNIQEIKKNNFKEMPLSNNMMGINTSKLHKTIENDMKEYDNMSKIMKDQIGNYNSKLNQMSKNIGNLNSSGERNNISIGENLNRKDFSKDRKHDNLRINNLEKVNNRREYSNNNLNASTERNKKIKNDFNSNNRDYSTAIENLNYRSHNSEYNYLNRVAPRGAYEKYNFEAYKKNRHNITKNTKNNEGLNYDYSNNAITINTLENTNPYNSDDNGNHKIDDLEKNIYHLKNRIESNLKIRENMHQKTKDEKNKYSSLPDSNNFLDYKHENIYNSNTKMKLEFTLLNKTIESNMLNLETDKNYNNLNNKTTEKTNILDTSTEENLNRNNLVGNYIEKYRENLVQEKSKNDPTKALDSKEIWQQQHNLKIEKLKEKPFEPVKTNENMDFQKNERKKVLDMIKDCKKEIKFYKQKISQENQDSNCFPDLVNKNKCLFDNEQNNKNLNNNNTDKNRYINNEINLTEAHHHKTNFTLGREQDFNYNNNNNNNNFNRNNNNTIKRPNSKSADRYTESKIHDLSINETYLTYINKNPHNDNSSNVNHTLDSASNQSALGRINNSKLKNNKKTEAKLASKTQNSSNKSEISKSKLRYNNTNNVKLNVIKNNKGDKSPIKILNIISSSKNTNILLRDKTNSTSNSKISATKKTINNEIKKSNMLTSKNTIQTNSNKNPKNKSLSNPKDLNSNKNQITNGTYLSTIANNNNNYNNNTKKIVTFDKLSDIDDISSFEENLEQMQKQKKEILLQENEILKEKIKHLEAKIEQIVKAKETSLNMNSNNTEEPKDNNNLILELQIWKNRSEKMSENYILTLNDLRNQLKQDRKHYVDLVRNMQSEFHSEVDRLKKAYEGNIIRNEKIVKKLKKENEDITKKLGKVKDIIALGQNNNLNNKK
jgi:hypothetical protein